MGKRNKISDEIGNKIIEMYNGGHNINQIRLYFNNSPDFSAVKKYLQKKGIIPFENVFRGYTYDECMEIGALYCEDLWDELYEKYPKLNKQKVYDICSHFGIKKEKYFWSKEDEEYLIKNYGTMTSVEISKNLNNRHSCSAINLKAEKIGLGNSPFWTDEEEQLLIENYSKATKEIIIKLFPNRTYNAIMNHAKVLGLKSYAYLNEKYSPEQKQFIIDNWQCMNDQQIADIISKTARGVMEQRQAMNLYRINKEYAKYEDLTKFFRGHIQSWKTSSMEACDYQCILTGDKNFDIHHLYGFNYIVNEAFKIIEKNIKLTSTNTEDYTKEQLDKMLEIFQKVHSKYPLGVCIRKDIHVLFHRIYGSGGNTPEQWESFVKDYKQGKYKVK